MIKAIFNIRTYLLAFAFIFSAQDAASFDIAFGDDTAIISQVCLYDATDGVNKITNITSEDAGLKITLTSDDSATQLIYDAAGEIEPITTLGTWSAPTASNIRFDDDINTGCYELQFAANSFEDGTSALLTIEDTSTPTFLDNDWLIHILGSDEFDRKYGIVSQLNATMTGLAFPPSAITVTSQTIFTIDAGAPSNNDALNETVVWFAGGTERDKTDICDYVGSTATVTLCDTPAFTIETGDTVHVSWADSISIPDGEITNPKFGADAINGGVIADDTFGATELASGWVDEIWDKNCTTPTADSVWEQVCIDGTILQYTDIATLTSQTVFTITEGSADNDAYNNRLVIIQDSTTLEQIAVSRVFDYVGATKEITLQYDPDIFTMAVTDNVFMLSSEF